MGSDNRTGNNTNTSNVAEIGYMPGISPTNYSTPFEMLLRAAINTQGFTNQDKSELRESLSNIRGLKKRALEGAFFISAQVEDEDNPFPGSACVVSLLIELTQDLESIENEILDRMLN